MSDMNALVQLMCRVSVPEGIDVWQMSIKGHHKNVTAPTSKRYMRIVTSQLAIRTPSAHSETPNNRGYTSYSARSNEMLG
jgi:hypothetical protein